MKHTVDMKNFKIRTDLVIETLTDEISNNIIKKDNVTITLTR